MCILNMKAMNWMLLQCYNMRAMLIRSRVFIKEFYDHAEKVKSAKDAIKQREQEISRREKA
jgi:3-methyladenine DNA glycosylase AlkD